MINTVEINEDLRDMVSTTIASIQEGMKDAKCGVAGTIDFEVAVIKSKEAKSKFKFFVADASGSYSKESISKISFKVLGSTGTNIDKLVWLKSP